MLGSSRRGVRPLQRRSQCPFGTDANESRDAPVSPSRLAHAATTAKLFGGMRDGEKDVIPRTILREAAQNKLAGAAGVRVAHEAFPGFAAWNNGMVDYKQVHGAAMEPKNATKRR